MPEMKVALYAILFHQIDERRSLSHSRTFECPVLCHWGRLSSIIRSID